MTKPEERDSLASKSASRLTLEIAVASFLVLFQELVWIRWLPGQVRVIAYFPNLILLSAFLGIGIGCLLAGRRSWRAAWPILVLVTAACGFALSKVVFTQNAVSELIWLLYYDMPKDAPVVADVRPPIVFFFAVSALSFVPLGQIVAERLNEFRGRGVILFGYRGDLLGSFFGVVAFAVVGFSGLFPVAWFAILFAAGTILFTGSPRRFVAYACVALTCLALIHLAERSDRYSPYYALLEITSMALGLRALLLVAALAYLLATLLFLREPKGAGPATPLASVD